MGAHGLKPRPPCAFRRFTAHGRREERAELVDVGLGVVIGERGVEGVRGRFLVRGSRQHARENRRAAPVHER